MWVYSHMGSFEESAVTETLDLERWIATWNKVSVSESGR